MKKYYPLLFSLFIAAVAGSCSLFSSAEKTPPPATKPMSFDYSPPAEGITKSNKIKFALINPRYVATFKDANTDPYKTFVKNMGSDFVEMLTARGYPYMGPYTTTDEMVYSDKKGTDLLLETEVDIQFTGTPLKYSTYKDYSTKQTVYQYFYDGDVNMSGKVNLIFSEPFTKTKVWVKSVPIDPVTFYIKSFYKYKDKNIPDTDPMVWNTLVDNLEASYQKVLQTSWNHLQPEELEVKKKEATEIKQNSGFIKN